MSYTATFSVVLGSSQTGLTLNAQVIDQTGTPITGILTSGFVEIGSGNYMWTYAGFPDGFVGGVVFRDNDTSEVKALAPLSPADSQGTVSLGPDGLDSIEIESGVNARQALTIMAAALAGVLKQTGVSTVTINGIEHAEITRVTAQVNEAGERLAVTVNLPS